MRTLVSPACTFATDHQRFDPITPTPEPTYELWHRTTAGMSTACGFLERGGGNAMIDRGRMLMRTEVGALVTYHLVLAGSYAGFPQPDLSERNRITPGPTMAEHAARLRR